MKLHLPIALSLVLFSGMSYAKGTYTPKDIIIVDENRSATEDDITKLKTERYSPDGNAYMNPEAIVKIGSGELTISQDVTLYNPFIVREGKVLVSGAKLVNQTKVQNSTSNLLIGGKGASLELDGSSYVQDIVNGAASVSAIAIGTSDGKGSLSLKNGSYMSTGQFIFAGYSTGLKGYGAGSYAAPGVTDTYNKGEFGRSSIYLSESELSAGTSLQFANVDVTIDDGGILSDNYRGKNPVTTPLLQDPASYLGYDGETVINVNAGGTLDLNWNVSTGFTRTTDVKSSTTITVSGDGAKISVAGTADFGGGESWYHGENDPTINPGYGYAHTPEQASSETSVSISDGAVGEFNILNIGERASASVTVGAEASIIAHESSTAALLTIMGKGSMENSGAVGIATVVDGGALTLNGGSMAAVTLIDGDIYVNGATTTGALTLTGGTITFDLSAQVATYARNATPATMLTVASLDVTGTKIVVNLSEEAFNNLDGKRFDLFSVDEQALADADIVFTNGTQTKIGTITTDGGSVTVTNTKLVPEPTTATLSLLALAALAARRRRK